MHTQTEPIGHGIGDNGAGIWLTFALYDRQGYVLVEYSTQSAARAAIAGAHGTKLLDQTISVDFAFVRPPPSKKENANTGGRGGGRNTGRGDAAGGAGGRKTGRDRSRSPGDGVKDE